jgi:hypothetical protein
MYHRYIVLIVKNQSNRTVQFWWFSELQLSRYGKHYTANYYCHNLIDVPPIYSINLNKFFLEPLHEYFNKIQNKCNSKDR